MCVCEKRGMRSVRGLESWGRGGGAPVLEPAGIVGGVDEVGTVEGDDE